VSGHTLRPAAGFNWMQIAWGAPDQVRTAFCSYCDQPLDEDACNLILWREDGWAAEFCTDCQRRWWGLE
jgi:hypothetical protein